MKSSGSTPSFQPEKKSPVRGGPLPRPVPHFSHQTQLAPSGWRVMPRPPTSARKEGSKCPLAHLCRPLFKERELSPAGEQDPREEERDGQGHGCGGSTKRRGGGEKPLGGLVTPAPAAALGWRRRVRELMVTGRSGAEANPRRSPL